MTAPSINTLLSLLLLVRLVFTRPSFCRFLTLFAGWVSTRGLHAVTEALVSAGVCYTLLVRWYMELGLDTSQVGLPLRPWYRTKHTVSFADILRLAQRTLAPVDWVDPRLLLARLPQPTSQPQPRAA